LRHFAVIYDDERVYAAKLAGFLNMTNSFSFYVRAISDREEFEDYCTNNPPRIALIDEKALDLAKNVSGEVFVLSSVKKETNDGLHYICKYQSGDRIIRDINEILATLDNIGLIVNRKTNMKIISYFTPVRRSLSTTLSIGMGQLLSRKSKTLYMNLESYSGLNTLLGKEYAKDIGDLFYHMHSKDTGFGAALASMVENVEGLDMIPPFDNQADLISIDGEEWKSLIDRIERETEYEYLIMDLSDAVNGLYELLHISDAIITTLENDEVAINKMTAYEENLKKSGYEDVLQKTKKCNVLHQHRMGGRIGNLGTGEFGDYVKSILQGVLADV